MTAATLQDRNRKVGLYALLGALAMLGLGYAAVPLYDLFCRVTGFGGESRLTTAWAEGRDFPEYVARRTLAM